MSNAFAMSTTNTVASMLFSLQWLIVSQIFINTSWVYLDQLKPFWERLQILFTILYNLAFRACEIILYIFERREMGLQFLIEEHSPFFGIRQMQAPRKLLVSSPVLKQWFAYFRRGRLRRGQHFLITRLLKPSIPAADLRLQLLIDLSSSSIERWGFENERLTFCNFRVSDELRCTDFLA